jgi:hypothetical protein
MRPVGLQSRIALLGLCFLCAAGTASAQISKVKSVQPPFATRVRHTVVLLGITDGRGGIGLAGTASLATARGINLLLTARHVVVDPQTGRFQDLSVIVTKKDGTTRVERLAEHTSRTKVGWFFHSRPDVDIAVLPFDTDAASDEVLRIPESRFVRIASVIETYDVLYPAFQNGLDSTGSFVPIIRSGMVSRINANKTFYVDGFGFPGNSGAPVFLKPSLVRYGDRGKADEDPIAGGLIGFVVGYQPYSEVAVSQQTGKPRVVFEENSGLTLVWPVDYLLEILDQDAFKKTADRLGGK